MATIPEVSVIIPTYNSAGTIESAIRSILIQHGTRNEIIVVDDGSHDSTEESLRKYILDGTVRYIRQENKGPAAARNRGIAASTGRYICFLDADDVLSPDSLQDRLFVYKKYPFLGLVFTDMRKIIRKGEEETAFRDQDLMETGFLETIGRRHLKSAFDDTYIFEKTILYELILFCFVWTGTVMTRRAVLDEVGWFNEGLLISEDHDLWLRICAKYPIAFRSIVSATYTLHEGGITKNVPLYYDSSIRVRSRYLNPEHQIPELYRAKVKKQVALYHFEKGYYCFVNGLRPEGKEEFRLALAYDPTNIQPFLYLLFSALPDALLKRLRQIKKGLTEIRRQLRSRLPSGQ